MGRRFLSIRGLFISTALIVCLCLALAAWQWERVYPYAALIVPLDAAPAESIPELALEAKIPLGMIKGRIDHMAFDPGRRRLFITELGNHTVGVVDVQNRKLETRLTGFDEPQGIGFVRQTDTVFIANGGTGVVELRQGSDLTLIKKIALAGDADNIRVDEAGQSVVVGYGNGGLAVLDGATGETRMDIPLAAHPESFQIDSLSQRIFVNEPKAFRIAVVDWRSGKELARWGASGAASNFPMALDADGQRLFVAYRLPALLTAFDTRTGKLAGKIVTCGDADDIFHDRNRKRLHVICGEGSVAVVDASGAPFREMSRLATRPGARTGLYVPDLDLLFVAAPAKGIAQAEILVYRPR
jgi:DNA-binding beta-propeller fold protein YncE